jgi:4'-phosphopantetheinyl transferase
MDPRKALGPCPAVEVVASRLDLHPGAVDAIAGWLHDDECRRAGRFRLARDRRRYVVARGREVGVDVEAVVPMQDADAVARHFFPRGELRAYRALEPRDRALGFFTCWTRKEAYLKALGGGLQSPLSEFDAPPGWSLSSFSPAPGHTAALAVEPRRNA